MLQLQPFKIIRPRRVECVQSHLTLLSYQPIPPGTNDRQTFLQWSKDFQKARMARAAIV